jgi:hypothetical protein
MLAELAFMKSILCFSGHPFAKLGQAAEQKSTDGVLVATEGLRHVGQGQSLEVMHFHRSALVLGQPSQGVGRKRSQIRLGRVA